MKRIKIGILILAIVLLLSAGIFGIAYYLNDKAEKEAKAEEDKLIMFQFDENDVKKVEINNEGGQFIAEYDSENGWYLTNTDEIELNKSVISGIIANMCELKAVKILEDTDKSKYGLDDPIKLTSYIGDTEYTLYLGDCTPTYENFYAMKENDDTIYLIEYLAGTSLDATKDMLKYRYIHPYMTYEVDHFALWEGTESDKNIRFSLNKDNDENWTMEKPNPDTEVDFTKVNEFLTDSLKDQVNAFIQEDCTEADYSKYGFDDPQYIFEISAGSDYRKIIFGDNINNNEDIYGLFVNSGQVVTFPAYGISILGYNTLDMMNTNVFSSDISNVSTVEITLPDADITLDMSEGENAYTFNGTNVSEISDEAKSAFITFFNSFNNAYFESVERTGTPTGEPEITIEYSLTSNIVTTLEYIPVPDSDEYYAVKNGEYTGFTINKIIVDSIYSSYEALLNITNS